MGLVLCRAVERYGPSARRRPARRLGAGHALGHFLWDRVELPSPGWFGGSDLISKSWVALPLALAWWAGWNAGGAARAPVRLKGAPCCFCSRSLHFPRFLAYLRPPMSAETRFRHHRRRRLPRLPSLRPPPRRGPPGHRASTTSSPATSTTSPTCAATRNFAFIKHDVTKLHLRRRARSTTSCTSPRPPARSTTSNCPSRRSRSARSAPTTPSAWPRPRGARFLLASTSEVYGDPLVHPQTEDYWGNVNPIGPRGVYDEAKRFAEAITMAYHRYHGVDTRIVRIFNTYGPRMRLQRRPRGARPSSARPCAASRSPSSATARRPAASATSPTWSTASTGCSCQSDSTTRSTSATPPR